MIGPISGELLGAAMLGMAGGGRGSTRTGGVTPRADAGQPTTAGQLGGVSPSDGVAAAGQPSAQLQGAGKTEKGRFDRNDCQSCKNRTYQDGSNDPGVSFKSPTRISADQSASAVMGHEMEHVNRNKAKAAFEGREVISQSVTLHNAICGECGRTYVSGGVTRTVTADRKEKSFDVGKQPERQAGDQMNAVA